MMGNLRRVAIVASVLIASQVSTLAFAEQFDPTAEVKAAVTGINEAHQNLGGMDGLGVIPEDDLQVIHGLLGDAEGLVRKAQLRAQDMKTPQDEAYVVGYARAGLAMAQAANEFRVNRGY